MLFYEIFYHHVGETETMHQGALIVPKNGGNRRRECRSSVILHVELSH